MSALSLSLIHISTAVSPFAVVGFLAVGVFAVLLLFSYARLMTISQQVVALNSEMRCV